MLSKNNIVFLLFVSFVLATPCRAVFIDLPKDVNGWTVFTPSVDTRIMYVSASGNDSTGQVYSASSPEVGGSPFDPSGATQAFATYAAAYAKSREGYPDWILFKRGETFNDRIGYKIRKGRSATEPFLVSSYGSSGSSPLVKTGQSTAFAGLNSSYWVAISGLEFYANYRDPLSPDYQAAASELMVFDFDFYAAPDQIVTGILIEGCKFRFYSGSSWRGNANAISGIIFRRNIITDNYSNGFAACGTGGDTVEILFEENILDHNGWYSKAGSGGIGQATMFSHNTYFINLYNSTLRGNIFLRGASMGSKFTASRGAASVRDLTIDNNLYYDNEIAISVGYNYESPYRHKNINISNNVILHPGKSRQTNRTLGWGIEIRAWDGGVVSGNYILHQDEEDVTNVFGLSFAETSRNVEVKNNVLYGLKYAKGIVLSSELSGDTSSNITFSGNKIQIPTLSDYTITSGYGTIGKLVFSNNIYYSDKDANSHFKLNAQDKNLAQWQAETNDNSTFMQVTFPDSTRDIVGYMQELGEPATIDTFIAKCRAQDRYNWDERFTAERVNSWIKRGYIQSRRLIKISNDIKTINGAIFTLPVQ